MKIKRLEFGLIETAYKMYKGKEERTTKWFFKQFIYKNNYDAYKSPCGCLMLDFGPFYITYLSNFCYDRFN